MLFSLLQYLLIGNPYFTHFRWFLHIYVLKIKDLQMCLYLFLSIFLSAIYTGRFQNETHFWWHNGMIWDATLNVAFYPQNWHRGALKSFSKSHYWPSLFRSLMFIQHYQQDTCWIGDTWTELLCNILFLGLGSFLELIKHGSVSISRQQFSTKGDRQTDIQTDRRMCDS